MVGAGRVASSHPLKSRIERLNVRREATSISLTLSQTGAQVQRTCKKPGLFLLRLQKSLVFSLGRQLSGKNAERALVVDAKDDVF